MPEVSVIIPTYNQSLYIQFAIDSVISQTYTDWELVIIDDGSSDNTAEIVAAFKDPRIKYLYQDNQERSAARNAGIRRASGKFIAFLDADDYWMPNYLEKQIVFLKSNPHIGLSRSWVYDIDRHGKVIRVGGCGGPNTSSDNSFLEALLFGNRLSSIAVVVPSQIFEVVGVFDEDLKQGEDWDMWLRIGIKYSIGTIPLPLANYRHYNNFMPKVWHKRNIISAYPKILEKAFDQLQDTPLFHLKSKAIANMYWRLAGVYYGLGDIETARCLLNKSHEFYPNLFPYQKFIESVAYWADELYDLFTPLEEAITYIDRVYENLPEWAMHFKNSRRITKGYYCGIHYFRCCQQRNWEDAGKAFILAINYRPSWLFYRGFLTAGIRSKFLT